MPTQTRTLRRVGKHRQSEIRAAKTLRWLAYLVPLSLLVYTLWDSTTRSWIELWYDVSAFNKPAAPALILAVNLVVVSLFAVAGFRWVLQPAGRDKFEWVALIAGWLWCLAILTSFLLMWFQGDHHAP